MPTTSTIRNNITLYLKSHGIDATKVLEDGISEEGYQYLLDPTEARRGQPVEEYLRGRDEAREWRTWPSPTVYPNLLRIQAGEKPLPEVEVLEPANADAQREQRGPDAAISGVQIVPKGPGPRGKEKITNPAEPNQ